jgi:hypothetical protein
VNKNGSNTKIAFPFDSIFISGICYILFSNLYDYRELLNETGKYSERMSGQTIDWTINGSLFLFLVFGAEAFFRFIGWSKQRK